MPKLPNHVRAFIGVRLSDAVREGLAAVQQDLRHAKIHLRWVRPENIHLTLLFLGETPLEQIAELSTHLREADDLPAPFPVRFGGVGAFPNWSRARVVWVGAQEGREELVALHEAVRDLATEAGCRFDRKRFSPHLTVGRVAGGGQRFNPPERLAEADGGAMLVEQFSLIRSELAPGGSIYTDLCSVML